MTNERMEEITARVNALLPARLQWAPHNLIAHPLSEVLYQLGAERASEWVHDATIPPRERGEGRE